jgi:hypothetical protein
MATDHEQNLNLKGLEKILENGLGNQREQNCTHALKLGGPFWVGERQPERQNSIHVFA